ncbi:hypothetical protein KVT40_001763 [Elsinoe batatas]|uniref:Methyltransferase type 11 domain-containing protein n=1 Tax=Elsinoe batatas TaxID=2601811 RepID=A0A8K0L7Y4_9PEZI|nr:hypothetical protein KVT40_001763 [Elsinoe batatas]
MSTSQYTPTAYTPRHTSWPYNTSDFTRQDSSNDSQFYGPPRFVTHIDDAAIESLRRYYDSALPNRGRILDFCSSWVSHYPARVEKAVDSGDLQVVGMGMNKAELDKNTFLNAGRIVQDLNENPSIPSEASGQEKLDASTCVVSIDYLTKPVEVLKSLRERTKPGGLVHLIVSNRCFPTKAVSRWLRVTEDERLQMVGDFLHFAGWSNIEIIDLKEGEDQGGEAGQDQGAQRGLKDLMRMMGMSGSDPLWCVRGRNEQS